MNTGLNGAQTFTGMNEAQTYTGMNGAQTLISTFQNRDNLDDDDDVKAQLSGQQDDIDDLRRE